MECLADARVGAAGCWAKNARVCASAQVCHARAPHLPQQLVTHLYDWGANRTGHREVVHLLRELCQRLRPVIQELRDIGFRSD
eukprot:2808043-Prorocentrum_lima.AAC.1